MMTRPTITLRVSNHDRKILECEDEQSVRLLRHISPYKRDWIFFGRELDECVQIAEAHGWQIHGNIPRDMVHLVERPQ